MKYLSTPFLIVIAAIPILYVCAPLVHLLGETHTQSVLTLWTDDEFRTSLTTSLFSACLTTVLAIFFGLPAAYVLSNFRFPGKRLCEAVLLLPLVLPPIVGGIAQLNLYGPNTMVGSLLAAHGIHLTDSFFGIVLAQSFVTSPFLIFAAKSGFDGVPTELLEATKLFGGGVWTQFLRVSIPLSASAIWVGITLTFARSIGEFGATMMMAYHPYTVPVDIWVEFTSGGLAAILPIAVALVILTLGIVWVVSWIQAPHGVRQQNKGQKSS